MHYSSYTHTHTFNEPFFSHSVSFSLILPFLYCLFSLSVSLSLAHTHTHTHTDMLVTATAIRSLLVYFLVLFFSSNDRTNYPFSSDRSLFPSSSSPIDESSHFKAERQDTKVIISFLSLFSLLRLIIGHNCAVFFMSRACLAARLTLTHRAASFVPLPINRYSSLSMHV